MLANKYQTRTRKISKSPILKGHADLIFREVGWRSPSDSLYYAFRPDLTLPIAASQANRPFNLRELRPEDIPKLLALDAGSESEDVLEVIIRLLMLKAGLATCFTIVTNDDIPWYLGWLIDSSQNEKIQKFFKGGIPALAPDEVLLEGGYTAERHRRPGLRIIPFLAWYLNRLKNLTIWKIFDK